MTFGRFMMYFILAFAAVYCGLTFYPGVLFSGKYEYKNITLYTGEPVTGPTDPMLERVYNIVMADDFVDPGQTFEIYAAAGYAKYAFLAPFCAKEQSCVHPATSKVFIASADLDKNQVYGRGSSAKPRIMESVVIRELVLAQMKKNLGPMKYISLRSWLKDGYAEHIARETVEMDAAAICGARDAGDPLPQYMESRLILDLVKGENPDLNYPALVVGEFNYENLRKRVMDKYCVK